MVIGVSKERPNMHNLGNTRSSQHPNHLLLTPDTFVRTTLPGMKNCAAIVHVGRAIGARFTQYTAEFEVGGEMVGTRAQRFIFVMDGTVKLETPDKRSKLGARGYAYVPAGLTHRITATQKSRVTVIEKSYEVLAGAAPPRLIVSHEDDVASHPLGDDPSLQVKSLLPDEMSFDFAVNTMVYQPGAALSMVEMHVMEHGLIMLEGGGIYRLGDSWYPVTAGDFIWMAPWCPQWFGAIGKVPAKYLIYKDWNRHPLAAG
jgi:(S)-ureidoglycine aminohydrolase